MGSEVSREKLGSWVEGGFGLLGVFLMEMVLDGFGFLLWFFFFCSFGRVIWVDGIVSDF